MNYTVCYFETVDLDCVKLFEFLKQGFSKYRFELDSIVEFSQVECRTVERALSESDLVWELPRLLACPHADLHAEFFFGRDEGYADRECKIPALAITADFRLITTSEGLTVCIISAPGDLYYEPNWSAPAKFFEFSLSAIVESLVSQFSIRIIDKRSPHLTPDYCLQLARSYASMEIGELPPVESICRIPGNSRYNRCFSDTWSVACQKLEGHLDYFRLKIEDYPSGRIRFV